MSNRAHRKWILDLMEEMDVGDDRDHDSDYAYDSSGKSLDPTFAAERRITYYFVSISNFAGNLNTHPKMCLVSFVIASHSNR